MTRMKTSACAFSLIVAAAFAFAVPAVAIEGASTSVSPIRNTVIAMTFADAAPLAAVAAGSSLPVPALASKAETSGAMAAMRPAPIRRPRVAAYERRVRIARNDLGGCSGCGSRHAVLMLGIGY